VIATALDDLPAALVSATYVQGEAIGGRDHIYAIQAIT
jgi:hypothetical protein